MNRSRMFVILLCLGLVATGCNLLRPPSTPVVMPREDTQSILGRLGGYPCPDSDFTCVALSMPLDHFDPADGRTTVVVFAVLPAAGERKGMFVTVIGGPGGSGLAAADSYTAAFGPGIPENFDIVFFDQRGIAASGGLNCIRAAAGFYQFEVSALTTDGETALTAAARNFATDCVAEMGNPAILPYLGTEQAIEDLEMFRQVMGDDKFWLYGESYGTQFVQTYAAAHPDRLAGLILDGPVDLTLSGYDYYLEETQGFDNTLTMSLEACRADENCAADMGGDPLAAYENLANRLKAGLVSFTFPLPSGDVAQRTFTYGNLSYAAVGYLYSETARMILLRAVAAAAARDDFVPLARIYYDNLSLDPQTLEPVGDPTWSDAAYYGIECNDYDYGLAEGFLRAGDAVDATLPRFVNIFYGDFPCAFWLEDNYNPGRPVPLTAEGIPTLVMVGTADPATPLANARRIISRLADGYLVIEEGGPHVIFGWGNTCVDDLVAAYLVEDKMPDQRETACPGVVTTEYLPLPPVSAADFANPLAALESVDNEIYYLPEYYYWDLETPNSVGCPFGGTLAFEPSDVGESLMLANCAFSQGFAITGTGAYNYDEDLFSLDVAVTGLTEGHLVYTRAGDGALTVTGDYAGNTVDLSK